MHSVERHHGSGQRLTVNKKLNAAANTGYLPRNGIASIEQTVSGLGKLYNLGPRITAVLAAYAVITEGNPLEGVWSIGGPLPMDELTAPLLGTGQGLSYSHNTYEGDSSIGRGDAYINDGDAHSVSISTRHSPYRFSPVIIDSSWSTSASPGRCRLYQSKSR